MRCLSCNKIMTPKEATRKYASTGTFIDLCDHCFADVEEDIPFVEGVTFNDTEAPDETESLERLERELGLTDGDYDDE